LAGEQPRQRRQHHPIGRLQVGTVHLAAPHGHLVTQDEQLDVLGPAITASWVNIRRICRSNRYTQEALITPDRRGCLDNDLAQRRTSTMQNLINEPYRSPRRSFTTA
jgi:hypothetical protein